MQYVYAPWCQCICDDVVKTDSNVLSLHEAVKHEDIEVIKSFIYKNKQCVHDKNLQGVTALHWAISVKSIAIVQLLIDNGANVHQADNIGFTPMYYAASVHSEELIKILNSKGASATLVSTFEDRVNYMSLQNVINKALKK